VVIARELCVALVLVMLGLGAQWAYRIVKQVGNYAESFERNIAPLGIERGLNRLWTDGGILYAPDLR